MNIIVRDKPSFSNQFKKRCQEAGVKYTQQRMLIYREVFKNRNHPDAESIFNSVRKEIHTISLDTVYRTLWLLKDMGLIRTLGPSRERTRFDANLSQHHHFICTQCNAIIDFNSKRLDELEITEDVKPFGMPSGLQINIQGICSKCDAKIQQRKEND